LATVKLQGQGAIAIAIAIVGSRCESAVSSANWPGETENETDNAQHTQSFAP